MSELRIVRRWAPWWLGVIAGGLYASFGWVVVRSLLYPDMMGEGIRIIIPVYTLAGYLALAIVCNQREVVVRPDGVWVINGPVPIGGSRNLRREDIWLCYFRRVVTYEDNIKLDDFHMAGVETVKGWQVDVSGPYKRAEAAASAANDIVKILNKEPGRTIEVQSAQVKPDSTYRKCIATWLAAFLLAILVGAVWEIARTVR